MRRPVHDLKSYSIDGETLRTGSANFSTSGEIVIQALDVAAKFDAHFERMWGAAEPMIEFAPAVKALEPR